MKSNKQIKQNKFISIPLLMQSIKSNWFLWLALTIGAMFIFFIINIALGSKSLFTNIDMDKVSVYVKDEGMSWLQILGLLETMGFSMSRIEIMSTIDMNTVLNDLIYKIAGVLLPMIYVLVVSNKLIVNQVNDGSMAYVLSTPTTRGKVIRTQLFFLFTSLFLMYAIILGGTLLSEVIARFILSSQYPDIPNTNIPLRTVLYMFGSFIAIFALGGICFGLSCWFNRTSYSLGIGGALCVIFFISCILGLFGSKVFVNIGIGVDAMYCFNYFTIFTLINTDSMSEFAKYVCGIGDSQLSLDWIWQLAILIGIGVSFITLGYIRFVKKDLPL